MVNPFLSSTNYDVETAIMLEKATVTDIGNAVAYTDGEKVFINTEDNLFRILPAYCDEMLKWLLWHERYHMELRHHNRFFKYLKELDEKATKDEFAVTKAEVNIIMDILVHDSLSKMFPELVDIAIANLAQMRNRNSLGYTFKTYTLEEMLDEYAKHKHGEDGESEEKSTASESEDTDTKDKEESKSITTGKGEDTESKDDTDDTPTGAPSDEDGEDKETKSTSAPSSSKSEHDISHDSPVPQDEHDKTDWSQLEEIDSEEFIDEAKSRDITKEVEKVKKQKIKLAQLTQTLNGLVTTTQIRSYKTPSHMQTGQHTIFKGRQNGKASLYLCFDASGSMGTELSIFKNIIKESIPQAMNTPTVWFSGHDYKNGDEYINKFLDRDNDEFSIFRYDDLYKGTFKDMIDVSASSGYGDDGDKTILLCWQAEQKGYSPIGITDGGGRISWSTDKLKELKRTIFIGHDEDWLKDAKKINPRIQTIYIHI